MFRQAIKRVQSAFPSSRAMPTRSFASEAGKEEAESTMKIEELKNFMTYFGEYVKPWAVFPLTVRIGPYC